MSGNPNITRLAIAGCGRAAEWLHAPALAEAQGVQLVAAIDPVPERRALIASQFAGCAAVESLDATLMQGNVDGVIVASPPAMHMPMLRAIVAAGLHALVEKPLALTMQDLDEVAAMVRQSSACVAVGYNRRFRTPVRDLRRAIQTTPQPAQVRYIMTSDAVAWSPITAVTDPLSDLGSHQLDLLRFVFASEILAIRAEQPTAMRLEMHVQLTGGVTAHCTCAQTDHAREDMHLNCNGKRYRLHIGSERIAPASGPARRALDFADAVKRKLTRTRSSFKTSYTRQLEAFAAQVRGEKTSDELADFDDGVAVVKAVDAARCSIEHTDVQHPEKIQEAFHSGSLSL